ncbi:MAG: arginine--tRNA ligase [Chloroflexi bacterium]|nr:arginine--tRNA ligase [Chloroflexota bacterium]
MTVATRLPLRSRLRVAVEAALERAVTGGSLPALPSPGERPAIEVARPAHPEHGDLATNVALRLARPLRLAPMRIAGALVSELEREASGEVPPADRGCSVLGSVSAAPPGFVNVRLADAALAEVVERVLVEPVTWGQVPAGHPARIDVEFVSANPTGPLHIGNARGAFVGDLLCRVLQAAGHDVTREYYFNDFGAQVRNLGASVLAIRAGQPVPDDGYHGGYVAELAAALPADVLREAARGSGPTGADADAARTVGSWASEQIRAGIEASLARLGVRFDTWTSESSLYRAGWVERAVERLQAGGHLFEQDGALWFRSTAFGDDKDRVVRKSSGDFTYFGSDIGYVVEKRSRGFDRLIYIWGADHHGTVARLYNAAEALGIARADVQVLLVAWVRFVRDGQEVSMSKRAGEFVTLDELLAEIGVDAARWFFAARSHASAIDFDVELAKRQSAENPVYYVQYAHARIASILRRAAEAGFAPPSQAGTTGEDGANAAPGLRPSDLAGAPEAALARALARFPETVEDAAEACETHGITTFATELATQFHAFYRDARVVDPADPERSRARLALVRAAQLTIAGALNLLGISAAGQCPPTREAPPPTARARHRRWPGGP